MSIQEIPCSNPKCPTKHRTHRTMSALQACAGVASSPARIAAPLITPPPGLVPSATVYAPDRSVRESWSDRLGRFQNGIETYKPRVADFSGSMRPEDSEGTVEQFQGMPFQRHLGMDVPTSHGTLIEGVFDCASVHGPDCGGVHEAKVMDDDGGRLLVLSEDGAVFPPAPMKWRPVEWADTQKGRAEQVSTEAYAEARGINSSRVVPLTHQLHEALGATSDLYIGPGVKAGTLEIGFSNGPDGVPVKLIAEPTAGDRSISYTFEGDSNTPSVERDTVRNAAYKQTALVRELTLANRDYGVARAEAARLYSEFEKV